jgi:hypothetical protein
MKSKLQTRLAKLERQRAAQAEAAPTSTDLYADVEAFVERLLKSVRTGKPPRRLAGILEKGWNDYLQAIDERLVKPEGMDWGSFLQSLSGTGDTSASSPKDRTQRAVPKARAAVMSA